MLQEIKVENFAIIDSICVQFKSGFNVLSGETGSGKSILLKSLALLMGDKSISGTIKTGEEQALVEGLFDISDRPDIQKRLTESGIDSSEPTLVVKRIISQDGKNRVYVNGGLSTLQQLRDVVAPLIEVTGYTAPLIEMTGQHENRNLQSRGYHLEALDQFAGVLPLRAQVEALFHEKNEIAEQIKQLEESSRSKNQRLDFLQFQRDEIKTLNLQPGEEDQLESEIRLLRDSSKLIQFIEMAEGALYSDEDSALVRIHKVLQKAQDFTSDNKSLAEKLEPLQQGKALIEESMYQLRDFTQNLNTDPAHQESLEQKLSGLRKVQKKYGQSVSEILSALQKIEDEISTLENSEFHLEELRQKHDALNTKFKKEAQKLHKLRVQAAPALSKNVNTELNDLNMKGLIFAVHITELDVPSAFGVSDVEFTTQTSKQDTPRALAKFASGGELSRILLSLKRVVGSSDYPRTYLFDEVDAGVSGVTAEKVGRKLSSIAKNQQVICVTHLPQVAAFADAHFVIQKTSSGRGVVMTVNALNKKEQVHEIARMLSGEKITKSSLAHAKELLELDVH